jgi:hypothetical protein
MRFRQKNLQRDAKIDIGKISIIARPIFRDGGKNGAQNFAAQQVRRIPWLLCWLGMKRAFALARIRFWGDRPKRAVIGNYDPGTDRNCDGQASRDCLHAGFNR